MNGRRGGKTLKNFIRDWQLHVFMILPLLYLLVFHYYPMFGVQIAFKNFIAARGIWGSPWVGFRHFQTFFQSYQFGRVVSNTLLLSFYHILAGFPLPVFFALILNTVRNQNFKKLVQTFTYIPHFVSTVVLVGMMVTFFSPVSGAYGYLSQLMGKGYPPVLMGANGTFRHFYVWSDVWQNLGWGTIIYIAALSAVSPELYEAAEIDGASRWQRIIHIDFPSILPTAAILLILRFGSIMSIGFEKVLLMQTPLNLQSSEIISTYVYKIGLQSGGNFSYAAAIGLFNSVINCTVLLLVNRAARKMSGGEIGLI
jgi:putative aldouronate transport system permease protein